MKKIIKEVFIVLPLCWVSIFPVVIVFAALITREIQCIDLYVCGFLSLIATYIPCSQRIIDALIEFSEIREASQNRVGDGKIVSLPPINKRA